MEKSLSNAFTYMFKDEDWKYKIGLLVLIGIPPLLISYLKENYQNIRLDNLPFFIPLWIILILIIALSGLAFEGYCDKCCNNIININNQTTNNLLPSWESKNFLTFLKIGISFSIGAFLLGLVVLISSFAIVPMILYLFAYIAIKTLFCIDFKISSFFAWKKAYKLISENIGLYIAVLLRSAGVYIVFILIAAACAKSLLFIIFGAIGQAYVYLVLAYLRGCLYSPIILSDDIQDSSD